MNALNEGVRVLAAQWAGSRRERQSRRALVRADFDQLAAAGFPLVGVPVEFGGLWQDVQHSTRPICDALRTLAGADPSVALVITMHPAVLSAWLTSPGVDPASPDAWEAQRRWVFQTVLGGAWWAVIASEPGSGGDVSKTKSETRLGADGLYRLTGRKHFGSGSGIASFIQTVAVPEGEETRDTFFFDVRGVPWDGSKGIKLVSEWNGHGMPATQSHAFDFVDFPATRIAAPGATPSLPFVACAFTAVIVGVVQAAIVEAKSLLGRRRDSLRAYERVEWSRAEMEGWLIDQAFEGMLRAIEAPDDATLLQLNQGKTAIAELSESVLTRLCRVVGGATFSGPSPFGYWFEDVRALGFLRPPWGFAYDGLFAASWPEPS